MLFHKSSRGTAFSRAARSDGNTGLKIMKSIDLDGKKDLWQSRGFARGNCKK